MDRRKFLTIMGAAGALSLLPVKFNPLKGFRGLEMQRAWAYQFSSKLTKFRQPLPGLGGPGGIQVASPMADPVFKNTDYYQMIAGQFQQVLHPDFIDSNKPAYIANFAGTKLWGYRDATQDASAQTHLGGVIVATRDKPVRLRLTNRLPATHILPVDTTIPGADASAAQNRTAVHIHGGLVPWAFDGGPFDWWTPSGASGPSFTNGPGGFLDKAIHGPIGPTGKMAAGQADYVYPNDQSYRLVWYHDHAFGITRLNAYAGVASAYLIRDNVVERLEHNGTIPPLNRLIPLVFQDKTFIPVDGTPDMGQVGGPGDLWYPSIYNDPPVPNLAPVPVPSCVPEFFGDTMLVNGVCYPFVEVEQREYRLLMLNACSSRFLALKLVAEDPANPGEPLGGYDTPTVGPAMVQIATEGGFLPMPVTFTGKNPHHTLLLGCAERAEVIVDFSDLPAGTKLLLYSDAPAPFPSTSGDPLTDYYPGNPAFGDAGLTNPSAAGFGPNTRTLMQIRVKARVGAPDRQHPLNLPPIDPHTLLPAKKGTFVRDLTLNEGWDDFGRLAQYVGSNNPTSDKLGGFGVPYLESNIQIPAGQTEIWRIANLTGDTHPMHFHLVNVQVISRRPFDPTAYPRLVYTGPARGPDPNEQGWKETVRMNPGEVIEVIARWDKASMPKGYPAVPDSPRVGGQEYVFHCHILEHEEHDMMNCVTLI